MEHSKAVTRLTILFLLALLLLIPACISNPNTKLDSHLLDLIEAEKRGEAESFAQQRNIELVDGSVWVIIECVPGQTENAASAATNAGATQVRSRSDDNLVKALVPITNLNSLANDNNILKIERPLLPVLPVISD